MRAHSRRSARARRDGAGGRVTRRGASGGGRGKRTVKVVPSPGRGLHVDAAAVVGHDPVDDRQAEAGALAEPAAERLEDALQFLRRHPDAVVGHLQDGVPIAPSAGARARAPAAARRPGASPAARWWPGSRGSGAPGSRRPRRARRARTRPPDAVPLAHVGAVAQQHRRSRCTTVRRSSRVTWVRCGPRVGEERLDRLVQPLRLLQDDVHQLRLVAGQRQLLTQHLHRPRHRGQRVPDLVRDAGGHLADRGQPLLHPRGRARCA